MVPRRGLLLDLVAAVTTGEADDELQLLCCIVHKLALQSALLCLCGPGESLVQVQQAVQRGRQGDKPPANCSPNLKKKKRKKRDRLD